MVNNLYQGMPLDPATGLYYERARWYSPSLGVWTSQDPAGYINGANTYQFVRSDPEGAADPSGLLEVKIEVGIPKEFNTLIHAFTKLMKDFRELEKPLHFVPGVRGYFQPPKWKWEKSPELKGTADFAGSTLCKAEVSAVGGGGLSVDAGAVATALIASGKIGVRAQLSFDFGVTAEYSQRRGWVFGGEAGGALTVAIHGTLEAWLARARAFGGGQGHITGTVLSNNGYLEVKGGFGLVAGVHVGYRSPWGPWETLTTWQAGFLNTPSWNIGTVKLGPWIEHEVESYA